MKKNDDLSIFNGFIKKKEDKKSNSKEVLIYTRVSSKNQAENNDSLEIQKRSIEDFCHKQGYTIKYRFGGTYESAKADFTREEFTKLIDFVKKQRTKPYGIVVYMINRFSRSGAKSIGILNELVEKHNVQLIESISGLDTSTPRGMLEITSKLVDSNRENLIKKEIVIPGMVNFLSKGNRFGRAPIGYDHYGPRVKNGKFLHPTQKIVVNETGKLIKEAFQLKLTGMKSDVQILNELKPRGLDISPQRLSSIWRTPFYCGISTSSLLPNGDAIEGNWEKIVTKKDFLKIQKIIEINNSGYNHKKVEEYKPLNLFLKCGSCGGKMVGYSNHKKNLSYYRCQKNCKGGSLNMLTTKKSLNSGAHELFENLLRTLEVNPLMKPLIIKQLEKIYNYLNESEITKEQDVTSNINSHKEKLHNLKIKYGMEEIDKDIFEITKQRLEQKINDLMNELNQLSPTISNLNSVIEKSLDGLENISKIWGSINVNDKIQLQKTIFPSGITYNKEKHQYLTEEINTFLVVTKSISTTCEDKKKGINQVNPDLSPSVARTRFELVTSGL